MVFGIEALSKLYILQKDLDMRSNSSHKQFDQFAQDSLWCALQNNKMNSLTSFQRKDTKYLRLFPNS